MGRGYDPEPNVKQPPKPPPQPPPKQPKSFSFRRFQLMEWMLSGWKHLDIGMQDQVRWGLRLSGAYLGVVLGGAGLFWLSIPYIDKWRHKEIMSGEFQRKIREKNEKALKEYSPEMIKNMEDFGNRLSGNVVYRSDWKDVDWKDNWGTTEAPPTRSLVDIMDEAANAERIRTL